MGASGHGNYRFQLQNPGQPPGGPESNFLSVEDHLDNAIGSLSGGQRQALTLLMATWLKPELLLLDEHTAALDPRSGDQVITPK
ncbi:MAG: ATP-binding cassette domain-containing protein [Verrucomicrobiota bacterium]